MTTPLPTIRRPAVEMLSVEADAVLIHAFPSTLSPAAAGPLNWTDYPAVDGPYVPFSASAVAYLGSADRVRGWWLHYTQSPGWQHLLILIAPCQCGTYCYVHLRNEEQLQTLLDELDTAPGAPVRCDYRLQIRSESDADQDHDSYEAPW
ncbi:hypothetical protein QIS99_30355 [Streptomyces sp. B-S-A8]|uniref:DUF4279 domain-containing protein n=1 Tax=Streptomyces solicavernae TaxID=3043614 RepID=A0ABT6S1C2_9ACTN|nr:hypothetical protein [Streptomyces sp. B-S-A8]MDI3390463.1 hypothetical protein [Streptomyces sp. B-S-A8]